MIHQKDRISTLGHGFGPKDLVGTKEHRYQCRLSKMLLLSVQKVLDFPQLALFFFWRQWHLIGQLNLRDAEEEWKSESIERIKQVPTETTELQTKLNDRAFMIKYMSWQSFITAVETYGPASNEDTWLN